jgi:PEP-CTERM motif
VELRDTLAPPTIVAGGEFILMPGITSDGGSHPGNGLFALNEGCGHDGGCSNCYFGLVATLQATPVTGIPEPSTLLLMGSALLFIGAARKVKRFAKIV